MAAGCIPIYPLKTIDEQWVKCNFTMCCAPGTYGVIPVDGKITGPWGTASPLPPLPDPALVPPMPHLNYFAENKRQLYFFNWKKSIHALMDHFIYHHFQFKPFFKCPMHPCAQKTFNPNDTDQLRNPVHGRTYSMDGREDSAWFKQQYTLRTHMRKVHKVRFTFSRMEMEERYDDLMGNAGTIEVVVAQDYKRRAMGPYDYNIL